MGLPTRLRVTALILGTLVVPGGGARGEGPPSKLAAGTPEDVHQDSPDEFRIPGLSGAGSGTGLLAIPFRSLDGRRNNLDHPHWGAAHTVLLRKAPAAYGDGTGSPGGQSRISARTISNLCNLQSASTPNSKSATDFLWQWGQFLDHDLDLTEPAHPPEPFDIEVPAGDPFFDPSGAGGRTIGLDRSHSAVVRGIRQQINAITSYIDASQVYGSDEIRARELRTMDGTGRLKTSAGGLLPFNSNGLPNAPNTDPSYFLAGDVRVNEQVGLTAMHTLFVREHNFWANAVASVDPTLSDGEIYQMARAIVGAEMQAITYREFLPILLGRGTLTPYRGYRPEVNASVSNAFATAAYRVGHTMLSSRILRLGPDGGEIPQGHLSLADAFFRPDHIEETGIEPVLRGLAGQAAQEIDPHLIDEVRNFLFGPPGAGGFDLASLNIQRGRDHGLPGYNQLRRRLGLPGKTGFADINPDPVIQAALAAAYPSVEDMDLWVGGLAEPHVRGAMVGETFLVILKDQFERLRDGDRFWYRHHLPAELAELVEAQTLSRIIRRNTTIGAELQADVFHLPGTVVLDRTCAPCRD